MAHSTITPEDLAEMAYLHLEIGQVSGELPTLWRRFWARLDELAQIATSPEQAPVREHQPRERAVPCTWCRRPTWDIDAICPSCRSTMETSR